LRNLNLRNSERGCNRSLSRLRNWTCRMCNS